MIKNKVSRKCTNIKKLAVNSATITDLSNKAFDTSKDGYETT